MTDEIKRTAEDAPGAVPALAPGASIYRLGPYALKQASLTIEQDEQLLLLLEEYGGSDWSDFGSLSVREFIGTLIKEQFMVRTFEIILEFNDSSPARRAYRKVRMWFTCTSKQDLIKKLHNEQVAEIIADFFALNLSWMPSSDDLSGIMTFISQIAGLIKRPPKTSQSET